MVWNVGKIRSRSRETIAGGVMVAVAMPFSENAPEDELRTGDGDAVDS